MLKQVLINKKENGEHLKNETEILNRKLTIISGYIIEEEFFICPDALKRSDQTYNL